MANSVASSTALAHRVIPEMARPAMAKADLRFPETDRKALAGMALERAAGALGWNLELLAQHLTVDADRPRDPRQVARWIAGTERIQLDVVMAHEELFAEFMYRLGKLSGSFDGAMVLVRRSA